MPGVLLLHPYLWHCHSFFILLFYFLWLFNSSWKNMYIEVELWITISKPAWNKMLQNANFQFQTAIEEAVGVAAWNEMSYLVSDISVATDIWWSKIREGNSDNFTGKFSRGGTGQLRGNYRNNGYNGRVIQHWRMMVVYGREYTEEHQKEEILENIAPNFCEVSLFRKL